MKSPNELSEEIAAAREKLKQSYLKIDMDELENKPLKIEISSFVENANILFKESEKNEKLKDLFAKDPAQASEIYYKLVAPIQVYISMICKTPQGLEAFDTAYKNSLKGNQPNPIIQEAI